MDRVEHIKPDFPPDAFAGTAAYYARYRVPYPQRLLKDLLVRADVTGNGILLDLACGPGSVSLAIASSFREVWAIDLEPEMIEVGRSEAALRGATNITWKPGRAEDLEAPADTFELITIGAAFHRLDQQRVAAQTLRWLKPRCCLATLGSDTILSGREPWQQIVLEIVRRWRNRRFPSHDGLPQGPGSGPEHNERVLKESGFEEVASYPFVEAHEWTIKTIVGYLYSTSACSKHILGGDAEGFESDLEAALMAHDPSGIYRENTPWGYTIGRKPS